MASRLIQGPLEVRLLSDAARGRSHSFRLGERAQRWLVLLAVAYALLLAGGLATAPPVVSSLLLQRDYEARASRRLQLGERLQALVDRLEEMRRQGALLAQRLARIEAIYEIAEPGGGAPVGAGRLSGAAFDTIFASTIAHGDRQATALARDLDLVRQRLETVAAFEREHADLVAAIPARPPLGGSSYVRTSGFGPRRSPFTRELELHAGLDLAAPIGTPIVAPAAGTVTFAGPVEADERSEWWRFGRLVVVRHGDRFLTLYGHCDQILVHAGQRVEAGAQLATVGETGWTTAPHLHYEIRRHRAAGEWQAVDPLDYAFGLAGEEEIPARRRPPGNPSVGGAPALLPAFLR